VSSDLNQNHSEKDFNQNQSTIIKLLFNITHYICYKKLVSHQLICLNVCFEQQQSFKAFVWLL